MAWRQVFQDQAGKAQGHAPAVAPEIFADGREDLPHAQTPRAVAIGLAPLQEHGFLRLSRLRHQSPAENRRRGSPPRAFRDRLPSALGGAEDASGARGVVVARDQEKAVDLAPLAVPESGRSASSRVEVRVVGQRHEQLRGITPLATIYGIARSFSCTPYIPAGPLTSTSCT